LTSLATAFDAVRTAFHDHHSRSYQVLHTVIWALILLSLVLVGIDIFQPDNHRKEWVDQVIVTLFAIELTLRVLTFQPRALTFYDLPRSQRVRVHVFGRLRYLFLRPLNIIDFICVLEFLHPAFRALRAVRALRLLRSARIFRYSNPFAGMERAFYDNALLWAFGFLVLTIAVTVGGVSLWMVDRGNNEQIQTVWDGMWWALVTITTVGYGDITPSRDDPVGRAIAAVLMVAGMVMLALFAGIVSSTLLNSVLAIRREQFRMSNVIDHVVICGYNEGARLLLDTLSVELDLEQTPVYIFAPEERVKDVPPEFRFIPGDPTKESELAKASIAQARAVIVVGTRGQLPQQADAITILTVFTIRRYMKKQKDDRRKQPLYLIAEILDHENVDHAFAAGCDEVIETTRLGFSLLSHAVNHHGTAALMGMIASADGQNLYTGTVPSDLELPAPFGIVAGQLHKRGVVVLGLRDESGEDTVNPEPDTLVQQGTTLIYIAPRALLG
jgi:voltage-gated potassium channel